MSMHNSKLQPTEQQLSVIEHLNGRAVVFAVAGSGKTTTMAWRVKNLIESHGVQPSRIVATTFSKKARDQMRAKFNELGIPSATYALTLHQFASRVITLANKKIGFMPRVQVGGKKLQREAFDAAKAKVLASSDGVLSANICDSLSNLSSDDFFDVLGKMKGNLEFTEQVFLGLPDKLKLISSIKRFGANGKWLELLIDEYESVRAVERFRGYDDMLVDALDAVYGNPIMQAEMSSKFDYIIVDEYQDINKAQDELVKVCDEKKGNLMVIGDDDQTIYEWRGAAPHFIREKVRSTDWDKYFLDLNFRSCAPQVILAKELIKHNMARAEKAMQATGDFSGELKIVRCEDNREQAQMIVSKIEDKLNEGIPLSQQVILVRRYDQTLPIEQVLIKKKIKYSIPGADMYFDTKEVQFLLCFLELIKLEQERLHSDGTWGDAAKGRQLRSLFNQVCYKAKTYLRNKFEVKQIFVTALGEKIGLGEAMRSWIENEHLPHNDKKYINTISLASYLELAEETVQHSVEYLIKMLVEKIDISSKIIDSAPTREIGVQRTGVIDGISSFSVGKTIEQMFNEIEELRRFWRNGLSDESADDVLTILTVFKSKGLEYPVVYMPDIHKVQDPTAFQNPVQAAMQDQISSDTEEERRIMYVAITRSIKDLYIYHWQEPSPFLAEARSDQVLEYSNYAKELTLEPSLVAEQEARRLGRWFSPLAYKYDLSPAYSNILGSMDVSDRAEFLEPLIQSIQFLAGSDEASMSDRLNYDKLVRFWNKINEQAFRVAALAQHNSPTAGDVGEQSTGGEEPRQEKDPFDELFDD